MSSYRSVNDLLDIEEILCQFFEVVIQNILHARRLYPETIFDLRKLYGIPVYQCIHPEVKDYITECLKCAKYYLSKRHLEKIYLCFHIGEEILEKYTFDIIDLKNSAESDSFLVDLEQSLRKCVLKLNASQFYVSELPSEASFSIRLQTTYYSSFEFNQDPNYEMFPWVQINESDNNVVCAEIVPLHTVITKMFNVQLYMEKES